MLFLIFLKMITVLNNTPDSSFLSEKKIGDFTPRLRVSLQSGGTGTLCRAQPTPGCRPRSCPKTRWLFL